MHARTYLCSFDTRERENTARHRTEKTIENWMEKLKKNKNKTPPLKYFFPACVLAPVKRKNRTAELLSAPYAARPSHDHLVTESVRAKCSSLSATISPVARLA